MAESLVNSLGSPQPQSDSLLDALGLADLSMSGSAASKASAGSLKEVGQVPRPEAAYYHGDRGQGSAICHGDPSWARSPRQSVDGEKKMSMRGGPAVACEATGLAESDIPGERSLDCSFTSAAASAEPEKEDSPKVALGGHCGLKVQRSFPAAPSFQRHWSSGGTTSCNKERSSAGDVQRPAWLLQSHASFSQPSGTCQISHGGHQDFVPKRLLEQHAWELHCQYEEILGITHEQASLQALPLLSELQAWEHQLDQLQQALQVDRPQPSSHPYNQLTSTLASQSAEVTQKARRVEELLSTLAALHAGHAVADQL